MRQATILVVSSILTAIAAFAKPTRSAIAAKGNSGANGADACTAKDYVQDGLVALWDGIENAGWGQHNGSATVWKDLVGDFDLTLGTASLWETNCLHFASPVEKGAAYRDEVIDQSKVQTIEVCFKVENGSNNAWIICINDSVSSSSSFLCMILRYNPAEGIMRNATVSTPYQRNYNATTIAVMSATGYVNAVDLGTRVYGNTFANSGWFCLMGRNGNTAYQPNRGKIFRCAIYSRPLSADEVAHNYAIDKERFGL